MRTSVKLLGVCYYLEKQTAPCRQTAEWHNQATAEARWPQGERVRKIERQARQTVRGTVLLRWAPESSNEARRILHIYISLHWARRGYHFTFISVRRLKGGCRIQPLDKVATATFWSLADISSSVFPSTLDKLKYFHIIIIIHFVPTSSVLLIPAGVNRWTIITRALISHHLPFCPSDSNLAPATVNGSDPPCLQTALAPNLRSRKVRCRVVSPAVHSLLGLTGHCLSLSHTHTKPSGFRLHNFSHYISYPHTHMLVSLQRVFQLK